MALASPSLIDDVLSERTTRPLVGVFEELARDGAAGVGLQSGDDTGMEIGFSYSTQGACQFLTDGDRQAMLIDFNFVDTVLDFIAAFELGEEQQVTSTALLTVYRMMLETALDKPESPMFHGILCDYLVSSATAMTHFGTRNPGMHNLGRAEYITRLVAVHEMAHGRIAASSEFTKMHVARFDAEVRHTLEHAQKVLASTGDTLAFKAGLAAKNELDVFHQTGSVSPALDELLCDHAMVNAAADAIAASEARIAKLGTYVALTAATLAMVWILPTFKTATRTLLEIPDELDLGPGVARDVRNVLAMLTFLRRTGVVLKARLGDQEGEQSILQHWTETADYEHMAVQLLNSVFDEANVTRLLLIGTTAQESGVTSATKARQAALRLLGWP